MPVRSLTKRRAMRPNNVISLKCTADSFFRVWIEFLTPFHKLTSRERDVAARIIAQYFKLKDKIQDPVVLREVLWSQTSRKDMRESLGMSTAHFQMTLGKLRDAGLLIGNDIEPRYIPHINDEPRFLLSILFDWSSKNNPVNAQKET